tara:strand:+ start:3645 stop:5138 length:1494 start_codon:yes stop_codon:yes gene_type:complete
MATIYSKERGKYGNITGQIIVWPVEVDNSITSTSSKKDLPAGYLRCDGGIYNALDYPQLAAICGTGTSGKFVRRDLANLPLQSVSDDQFVVPDLGSKYPKPTGSAGGGGIYSNIRVTTVNDVEKSRSGIGIDADAIAATDGVIDVEYSGNFVIPSHDIPMRGRPSWTVGTSSGRRTETEAVDSTALHAHMHFHSGTRTRLKARGEVDENSPTTVMDPTQTGPVGLFNASTIPLHKWIVNTTDPSGNNWPGNAQQPCKAIASNQMSRRPPGQGKWGAYPGVLNPVSYSSACINNNVTLNDTWKYYCLLPPESYLNANGVTTAGNASTTRAWEQYPIPTSPYTLTGDSSSRPYSTSRFVLFGCGIIGQSGQSYGSPQDIESAYRTGASGVPVDWQNLSWADSMPLQYNASHSLAGNTIYPSTYNEFNQTDAMYTGGDDPTEHFHKLNIVKEDHTYELRTDSTELAADLLNTTLQLSTDESRSVDNVTAPFIILEYLIKI